MQYSDAKIRNVTKMNNYQSWLNFNRNIVCTVYSQTHSAIQTHIQLRRPISTRIHNKMYLTKLKFKTKGFLPL